jgi:hypothetical protein
MSFCLEDIMITQEGRALSQDGPEGRLRALRSFPMAEVNRVGLQRGRRKMIDQFFAQAQKLLPEIHSDAACCDGKALDWDAHKPKSSMGS